MSNSIWKTDGLREASTKKLILYFAGGGRIPYTGWNHPDIMMLSSSNESWWNYTDVMRWCYVDDLIAQADKAERLQKDLEIARKALESISGVRGNIEDYYGGVSIHYQQMVLHMDEIATNALEQIDHIADVSKMVGQN